MEAAGQAKLDLLDRRALQRSVAPPVVPAHPPSHIHTHHPDTHTTHHPPIPPPPNPSALHSILTGPLAASPLLHSACVLAISPRPPVAAPSLSLVRTPCTFTHTHPRPQTNLPLAHSLRTTSSKPHTRESVSGRPSPSLLRLFLRRPSSLRPHSQPPALRCHAPLTLLLRSPLVFSSCSPQHS